MKLQVFEVCMRLSRSLTIAKEIMFLSHKPNMDEENVFSKTGI